MEKQHIISAFLILLTMVLTGCSDINNPTHELESDFSISNSNVELPENYNIPQSSVEDEESSSNSSEQSSDVSNAPVPVEFTDEDRDVQKIIENLESKVEAINVWFTNGAARNNDAVISKEYHCRFPEIEKQSDHTYLYHAIPKDYSEAGFVIPNTYERMREFMLEVLSEETTDTLMKNVSKGSMAENPDGTYTVKLDRAVDWSTHFIEIDGIMYRENVYGGRDEIWCVQPETVKLTLRTDDTIEFRFMLKVGWNSEHETDYVTEYLSDISLYNKNCCIGILKYERGGWRRHTETWGTRI